MQVRTYRNLVDGVWQEAASGQTMEIFCPCDGELVSRVPASEQVDVDRAVAVSRGLVGPFVHDLCAYGYACRLAIAGLFPGQPERLRRMYAAMKTVLYPDTPVELHLWKLAPGRAAFRLCHGTTGKAILDRGELEWDEVV